MDPNLLKHIEYFLEPNSQVRTPSRCSGAECASLGEDMSTWRRFSGADTPQTQTADLNGQQQRRFDPTAAGHSPQGFWDMTGLNVDSGLGSPSSAPTSLSFESFAQPATPAVNKPQQSRPQQMSGQGSRVILPPRPPKSKTGHERKRTKLSTESTPFDNVDYWLQFDNEEGAAAEASNAELNHQKGKGVQPSPQLSQQQRPQR